mmetsp:Transcript_63569/g.180547  ORF Transcript_63569/g.180547 Transcript_63569/m.180547 type:complete len:158 (-) Transcript_63569:14-487(-)
MRAITTTFHPLRRRLASGITNSRPHSGGSSPLLRSSRSQMLWPPTPPRSSAGLPRHFDIPDQIVIDSPKPLPLLSEATELQRLKWSEGRPACAASISGGRLLPGREHAPDGGMNEENLLGEAVATLDLLDWESTGPPSAGASCGQNTEGHEEIALAR